MSKILPVIVGLLMMVSVGFVGAQEAQDVQQVHDVPFEGRVLVSVSNNLKVAVTFIMKPLFNTTAREIKRGLQPASLTYVEIGYLDAGPYLTMAIVPGHETVPLIKHVVLDWLTRDEYAKLYSTPRQVYQLKLNIPEDFHSPTPYITGGK